MKKSYRFKRIKHYFEYIAVVVLMVILNRVPRGWALAFGDFLGWFGFNVLRIRRQVVLSSLHRVFGDEKSTIEIQQIAQRTYQNFCKSMIEFGLLETMSSEDLTQITSWQGLEILQNGLLENGVIVITAHFGSWELLAASAATHGLASSVVTDRMHNRLVDAHITKIREKHGCQVIQTNQSVRDFLRALRNHRILALLSDQDSRKSTIFVDFLGKPAATPTGAAIFHLKTKAPIIPVFIVRDQKNHHIVYVEPPLQYTPTGDRQHDVHQITQKFTKIIETYIRRYPDHWFWMHRRWKRQPPA